MLEDHGCVAAGFLDLLQATGDPVWLERAGALLDAALDHFAAEDGGFFDTADDAEALVARPRDPSDNASPCGLSAMVHALSTYAALTGSGRHRDAAEAGARDRGRRSPSGHRASRAGRWRPPCRCSTGREEIAVVGPPGPDRDALALAARRRLGAVVVVADGPRDDIPLLVGRTRSTAGRRRTSVGTSSASGRSPTRPRCELSGCRIRVRELRHGPRSGSTPVLRRR